MKIGATNRVAASLYALEHGLAHSMLSGESGVT